MSDTIESKVAETILQEPEVIKVGDKTYEVAPPSCATLILVSEAIANLPKVSLNSEEMLSSCLAVAKNCRPIGDVAALLILGAKGITKTIKTRETTRKRFFWGILPDIEETEEVEKTIDLKKELSTELLETLTPRELSNLIAQLLKKMQLGDFFGITTFLCEINLTKQTKVDEQTAYGQ